MSNPQLAYVDANVFLAYAAGPEADPYQYPLAKAFFKGMASRRQIGVLSYLTIMEMVDVLRKWKGSEFDKISGMLSEDDRIRHVIDGASAIYKQIMIETLATPEFRIIDIVKTDMGLLLRTAFEILTDMKGVVRLYDKCGKCGYKTNSGEKFISVHKCVGTADILHVLLAKDMGCQAFVTLDKGFQELVNDPRIKPLRIEVLSPRR